MCLTDGLIPPSLISAGVCDSADRFVQRERLLHEYSLSLAHSPVVNSEGNSSSCSEVARLNWKVLFRFCQLLILLILRNITADGLKSAVSQAGVEHVMASSD